jgi:hypothetical protein
MKALRWADVTASDVVPLRLCGYIHVMNVPFLPPGKKR